METEREIDEAVARCVASVVYYHNCGRTARAREILEADASEVADWVETSKLTPRDVARLVLRPVRDALLERYDRPLALALHDEFALALDPEATVEAVGPRA